MKEKEIDILLSKADFFKIISVGSAGYGLVEIALSLMDPSRKNSDIILGAMVLASVSLGALIFVWHMAQRVNKIKTK